MQDNSGAPPAVVAEELELLHKVRERLLERPVVVGASDREIIGEMERLREDLAHAKNEDLGAMIQQYDQLYMLLAQLREGRNADEVDPDSPYFAHLRLAEDGRKRDLFLGRVSRVEQGVRIVDWRNAPVSRIYYQYDEGDEYEEELGDRLVEGQVEARRTLSVTQGCLRRVACPQGVFVEAGGGWRRFEGEGRLPVAEADGRPHVHEHADGSTRRMGTRTGAREIRRDKHLPDIAALIDPAQFNLVTHPEAGVLVLRGGAGSGKTTVALHRVAWLAFQDKVRYAPDRMAVVVWGRALRDYIGRVLPSLGVDGVEVVTWAEWSSRLVRANFTFLPRGRSPRTPDVVVRLKLHPAMLQVLQEFVTDTPGAANPRGVWMDLSHVLTDVRRLEECFSRQAPGAFNLDDFVALREWSRAQQSAIQDWSDGHRDGSPELDEEDDALLLRLFQLRIGPFTRRRRPIRYSHLVVDEAQDFSAIELAILLDTVEQRPGADGKRQRCVTLAGDTQQHILQDQGFADWADLFRDLRIESRAMSTLRVGYRSTRSISAFSNRLLGAEVERDQVGAATRDGAVVEVFRFTDHGGAVAFLADVLKALVRAEPNASVALITPDPGVSALYFIGLERADVPRLRLVRDQAFAFSPGVEVTEVGEVKGLEFDYVVLVETSAAWYPDTPHARRLLYVGATRASHQLWVTCVGTPSPVLEGVLA